MSSTVARLVGFHLCWTGWIYPLPGWQAFAIAGLVGFIHCQAGRLSPLLDWLDLSIASLLQISFQFDQYRPRIPDWNQCNSSILEHSLLRANGQLLGSRPLPTFDTSTGRWTALSVGPWHVKAKALGYLFSASFLSTCKSMGGTQSLQRGHFPQNGVLLTLQLNSGRHDQSSRLTILRLLVHLQERVRYNKQLARNTPL